MFAYLTSTFKRARSSKGGNILLINVGCHNADKNVQTEYVVCAYVAAVT